MSPEGRSRSYKKMLCPHCGEPSDVMRSHADGRGVYERSRICDAGHRFDTIEQVQATTVSQVGVENTGRPGLIDRLDPRRLRAELARATFYTGVTQLATMREISTEVVSRIVSGEVKDGVLLPADPDRILRDGERLGDTHRGLRLLIKDTDIIELVEQVMAPHEHLRLPRIQYALVFRGRNDRRSRPGWDRAGQFLAWLKEAVPTLEVVLPQRMALPGKAEHWTIPATPGIAPELVVKRDPSRGRVAFVRRQFEDSISRVLFGRKDALLKREGLASFVLAQLAGQPVVTSAQLAATTLNALRRVDEIAYLRAATTLKGYQQVSSLQTEAVALLTTPSRRLNFAREGDGDGDEDGDNGDRGDARA